MAFADLKGINHSSLIKRASFDDVNKTICWLQSYGLLAKQMICVVCLKPMTLGNAKSHGKLWRCTNHKCRTTQCVRKNSFFECSNLKLKQSLTMLYCWSRDYSFDTIELEARVSRGTCVQFHHVIRKICSVELKSLGRIGGSGCSVAVDGYKVTPDAKSKCGKRIDKSYWVISCIDLDTKECVLSHASVCNEENLLPIVNRYVVEGSVIYWQKFATDFDFTDEQHYCHKIISPNKKVQGITKTCIKESQSLFSSWRRRQSLKSYGQRKEMQMYMDEFMWRRRRSRDIVFADILEAISRHYVVSKLHGMQEIQLFGQIAANTHQNNVKLYVTENISEDANMSEESPMNNHDLSLDHESADATKAFCVKEERPPTISAIDNLGDSALNVPSVCETIDISVEESS